MCQSRTKRTSWKFPNLELKRSTLAGTGDKTRCQARWRVRFLQLKLDEAHRNTQKATMYTWLLFLYIILVQAMCFYHSGGNFLIFQQNSPPPPFSFFFFFLEQMARSLFQITSTRKLLFLPHVCMCECTMFHIFA